MKIEKLKKSYLKRNLIIGIVAVLIISAIILNFTKAKYRTTQSIPLVNGTINYSLPDLNIIGLYIDGEQTKELDKSKAYTLDAIQSTCTYKDGSEISNLTIDYEDETRKISISPFTSKGTKCTLYFNEVDNVKKVDTALGTLSVNMNEPIYVYGVNYTTDEYGCYYNGVFVSNTEDNPSEKMCQDVYKIGVQDYYILSTSYYDKSFENIAVNLGQAVWDSSSSSCTFNGNIVTDYLGNKIKNINNCGEVYQIEDNFITMIENVGAGVWTNVDNKSGLYAKKIDNETTYYYRGNVTNNYLVFADKYWRIIRINEDGSIRIIYNGEKSTIDSAGKETILANGYDDTSTLYTQIGMSAFNNISGKSEYVGYTYSEGYQRPIDNPNGETNSTIKEMLDNWYSTNIGNNKEYDSKVISGPGFCNDRELASGYEWNNSNIYYYNPYERIISSNSPTFECNKNDLYKTKIGLITADEIIFAGSAISAGPNEDYYLYNKFAFLTMSPATSSTIFYVSSDGTLSAGIEVDIPVFIRPVINISSDATITGTGTINDPYIVN